LTCDSIDLIAKAMVADLHAEPDAVQEAYRYLFAQVAVEQGILVLIGQELREGGTRLVYQEPGSGAYYAVTPPASWTDEEEAEYVAEMRRNLLGEA
jgi:hypothetical protein